MSLQKKKLYVIVRGDLSSAQRAVQAGHAVAEWCLSKKGWSNGTLVYLKAMGFDHMRYLFKQLDNACAFYEPYYDGEMTAFAYLGEHELFEELPLL